MFEPTLSHLALNTLQDLHILVEASRTRDFFPTLFLLHCFLLEFYIYAVVDRGFLLILTEVYPYGMIPHFRHKLLQQSSSAFSLSKKSLEFHEFDVFILEEIGLSFYTICETACYLCQFKLPRDTLIRFYRRCCFHLQL